MTGETDFDALEASLTDRECEVFNRLKQSYQEKMTPVENTDEKTRKAALLSIKRKRASIKSGEKLIEGIENPDHEKDELIESIEIDVEASHEYREYLNKIGVLPVETDTVE
ncbi:hypothetical protein PNP85_15190 [Halobacterium salinarum]|uniref:hypothetical protein n=1 Tax=Halobacterium salinarum TaxID=2242 RepID=UPI002553BA44|nr:hypothetical protein [Halobacterium salinarum]MDL0136382.1 hypothetical protein [Halobacterium salinarum]MDL0140841.1 hypothetical protein [Halobacterium salinarum]